MIILEDHTIIIYNQLHLLAQLKVSQHFVLSAAYHN